MKLLKEIPKEKYNDVQWVLDWLKHNSSFGDENPDPIEYFHCFWKGKISDLHLMSLDSLHKTHPNSKIILWTTNALEAQGSYSWIKIKKLLKDKIELIEVNKNHFDNANASILYSKYSMLTMNDPNPTRYNHNIAYASDIIRFVVLYIYGGIWFDLDVYFLKDFNSIKLNRYVSQWGTDMCGNAAILRLEKGHDLIQKVVGKYERPFYPTSTFKLENDLDLTILPSTLFDILWRGVNFIPDNIQFKDLDEFFIVEELKLPNEIYAYHWHNRWNKELPKFYNYDK